MVRLPYGIGREDRCYGWQKVPMSVLKLAGKECRAGFLSLKQLQDYFSVQVNLQSGKYQQRWEGRILISGRYEIIL